MTFLKFPKSNENSKEKFIKNNLWFMNNLWLLPEFVPCNQEISSRGKFIIEEFYGKRDH